MNVDLWFSRYEGKLFFVFCEADEAPQFMPNETPSVHKVIQHAKENGYTLSSVGILPPEMLGLE